MAGRFGLGARAIGAVTGGGGETGKQDSHDCGSMTRKVSLGSDPDIVNPGPVSETDVTGPENPLDGGPSGRNVILPPVSWTMSDAVELGRSWLLTKVSSASVIVAAAVGVAAMT